MRIPAFARFVSLSPPANRTQQGAVSRGTSCGTSCGTSRGAAHLASRVASCVTLGAVLGGTALLGGCHPLVFWHPADLPKEQAFTSKSTDEKWPQGKIDISVDKMGVPHIQAQSEADLSYGLGVMHGRDRLFQVLFLKHAAQGRLTELLGDSVLSADRYLRLIALNAHNTLAALSPRDRSIVEAYCAGINHAAKMVGQSAEMAILGVNWTPLTPYDVVTITLLQSWDQSSAIRPELSRARVLSLFGDDSKRSTMLREELLVYMPSTGTPIVRKAEHTGAFDMPIDENSGPVMPFTAWHHATEILIDSVGTTSVGASVETKTGNNTATPNPATSPQAEREALLAWTGSMVQRFLDGAQGASNSWALDAKHTASGKTTLANDPHLSHGAPSVFYMAHLVGPAHSIAGVSFPGIPAVLIGHGDHIAWGITNSFADVQDLLKLETITPANPAQDAAKNPQGTTTQGTTNSIPTYMLDGKPVAMEPFTEKYVSKSKDSSKDVVETWYMTPFGPVLPSGHASSFESKDTFVLQWTAYDASQATYLISSFWDLAYAKNNDELTHALQEFSAPPMNFAIILDDGSIHYRLSGRIPVRQDGDNPAIPNIHTTSQAPWRGYLRADGKPQLDNPERGYLVASNQRIVDEFIEGVCEEGPSQKNVGYESSTPYRAARITERIEMLLQKEQLPTADEILAIQQDVHSIEAASLAPILGKSCLAVAQTIDGHPRDQAAAFCSAVASFDAEYTKESLGALPYTRLFDALQEVTFNIQLPNTPDKDKAVRQLCDEGFMDLSFQKAIERSSNGEKLALFDDPSTPAYDGINVFVGKAAKLALDRVVAETGNDAKDWRWGRVHRLPLQGRLAAAPLVGGLFSTPPMEEAGHSKVPRAEAGTPVNFGSGMRFLAELSPTSAPRVRFALDSGQSGHHGHRHLADHYPLWSAGTPFVLPESLDEIMAQREGWLVILPAR